MLKVAAVIAAGGFIFQLGAYTATQGTAGLALAIPVGLVIVYPLTTAYFWLLGTVGLFIWRRVRRLFA